MKHLIFEADYKRYHEIFLNKVYAKEYYRTKEAETSLKMNFVQAFEKHNLQRFMCLSKKYNPNHVKAFYCYVKIKQVIWNWARADNNDLFLIWILFTHSKVN